MPSVSLSADRLEQLQHGAIAVRTSPAAFSVSGSGAVECIQGLLTSDIGQPGDNSMAYGAMLTPKGAIVVDQWVLRLPDRVLLLAESAAREVLAALLKRSIPPRLAKVSDVTGTVDAVWLYGHEVVNALGGAGLELPQPGRVNAKGELLVARPQPAAPFQVVLTGPTAAIDEALPALVASGVTIGDEAERETARILAGWPLLGSEIGERTLVQEVRYDEIGGVSYTKGCYTGQETVARLHFRGHTNRELRGLVWRDPPRDGQADVVDQTGKELGQVSSLAQAGGRSLGLSLIRREVEPGTVVVAGGSEAVVTALPFPPAGQPANA